MKLFTWNTLSLLSQELSEKHGCVSALTIGGFDGPHIGHQALFNSVQEYKNSHKDKDKILTGVITFNKPPKSIFLSSDYLGELSSLKLKLEFFEQKLFDYVVVIDFSDDFSKMIGYDFLNILRKLCSMQFLAIGSDFRCGCNNDTSVAEISSFMKQFDLELKVCEQVVYQNKRISSSFIREAVSNGNFELANALLGYSYCVDSTDYVWQKNSSVTYITSVANRIEKQVLPKNGKYCVSLYSNKEKKFYFDLFLYVESNFLRLEIPLECNITNITKIIFD